MKYPVFATLLAVLLAGCADTPTQDASIEDRALASKDAKKSADAKAAVKRPPLKRPRPPRQPMAPRSPPSPPKRCRPRAWWPPIRRSNPSTDPRRAPRDADGKPIGASGGQAGAPGQAGVAGQADAVLLDPKNPASPLVKRRILFDYDSAAIRDEYRSLLESHAKYLLKEKAAKVILQGHADERGSREYNLALGQRRSESVYKALSLLGVPDAQLEAVSFGEEKPVAEGHDEEAWMQNRRTEILYEGE
jgi:peptidoglycan-associated lipoprotein